MDELEIECDGVLRAIENQIQSLVETNPYNPETGINNAVVILQKENSPEDKNAYNKLENNVDNTIKKGRKRKKQEDLWKRHLAKAKRNKGEAYVNSREKNIPNRQILPTCEEKCIFKCSQVISEEERKLVFNKYWALGNLQEQRHFIRSCLTPIDFKVKKERRLPNNKFYFEITGRKIRVCKLYFVNTLGISDRTVRTVLEKSKEGVLENEKRGKHENHKRVDSCIISDIVNHINSIPRIESHYLRAQTCREYIDGGKTIADLHRDYVEICKSEKKPYGNYTMFYRIFTTEFNISFFIPKKDLCNLCEEYKNSSNLEKVKIEEKYSRHLREKELSRKCKEKDKQEAFQNRCVTACFDLQAILPSPCGEINKFYYKSRLSTYNLTVYDIGNKTGHCFVWHEGDASRGVNEVGTCLLKFLETVSSLEKPVILYADNCSGQNKNKYMISMLMNAVQQLKIPSITLNFLIVGHTQNEGDAMHSLIEKQKKRTLRSGPIYIPAQWVTVIKDAKKTGRPFIVNELDYDSFFDLKSLEAKIPINFQYDETRERIFWQDVTTFKVVKNEPFTFYYKNSYDDEEVFKRVQCKKLPSKGVYELTKLYSEPRRIDQKKLDGILELCSKNYIIKKYHNFYYNLAGINPGETLQVNGNDAVQNMSEQKTMQPKKLVTGSVKIKQARCKKETKVGKQKKK